MLRAENASDNEPWIGLARDLPPTGTCYFVCNAAEGIPRGNIWGGRDPLAGGTRTGCSITPRSHMFPTARRSRDSPPGCICGAERRFHLTACNVKMRHLTPNTPDPKYRTLTHKRRKSRIYDIYVKRHFVGRLPKIQPSRVEQSPRSYDPTGNKSRSERGNLPKITRYEFGNLVRYEFGS
jgi:hypothetical protein